MILIDANNLVWRAHHAGMGLSSKGRPTAVLHVGLSMVASLPDLLKPSQILFLWDGGVSWRKKVLPCYKANRDHSSSDRREVFTQIAIFRAVLTDIGVDQIQVEGLEADDLAGILTDLSIQKDKDVTLVSGDKDWFQLLGPKVVQLKGWKGKKVDLWTSERLKKEYGISSTEWDVFLALTGDSVDNIPKVRKGLGPVGARKLLLEQSPGNLRAMRGVLTDVEFQTFSTNLQVTRVLREYPMKRLREGHVRGVQNNHSWNRLEKLLINYDLLELYKDRGRLWEVGKWK